MLTNGLHTTREFYKADLRHHSSTILSSQQNLQGLVPGIQFPIVFMPFVFSTNILTKHGSIVLKWNELIFCYYTKRTLIDRNHLYAIYILPISKFLSASLLYGFLDKTMEKISLRMMVTYCDIHSPRAKVPLIKCCGGLFYMKQNLRFALLSWFEHTYSSIFLSQFLVNSTQ